MSETKHTPTARPWIYDIHEHSFYIFSQDLEMVADGDPDDIGIARMRGTGRGADAEEQEANAALICLAVNSHDELLEACESATEELQTLFMTPSNLGRGIGERLMAVHAKLKAAIKKAGR